ncbi:endo-1,4-beta-xylanase, partial [Pseudorhodoplanes sp.]|uniref:endo-1,4-beta-xylanase n=1 Tax=Pseudorhodoplanes sp. TaxID=1934341 RepID=UPI002BCBE953
FDQHIYRSPAYAQLLARECAILTPDYSMKFGSIRAASEVADFNVVDRLFEFAAEHKLKMRGHTLIWNDHMPDWTRRLSSAEMTRLLDRHIDEVAGRYSGRVHSWDVVNEPIWVDSRNEGGLRGGPWYAALGRDYIARSFRRARQADPHGRLVLNEAFLEYRWFDSPFAKNRSRKPDSPWSKVRVHFLDLVRRLRDDGVPLDAIGIQSHLSAQFQPEYDRDSLLEFLDTIKGMGLDIQITELDVDDTIFPEDFAVRDRGVAKIYRDYLTDVLSTGAVRELVTWELSDRHTSTAEEIQAGKKIEARIPRSLPFDFDMNPKPAYGAIVAALKGK